MMFLAPAAAVAQAPHGGSAGFPINCPSCTLIDATLTLSGAFTSNVASGSSAVKLLQGAKICLNSNHASPCTTYAGDDGSGALLLNGRFGAKIDPGGSTADVAVTEGHLKVDTFSNNFIQLDGSSTGNPVTIAAAGGTNAGMSLSTTGTGALVLGNSTTTRPVQVAGGSGAFVGSCAPSSAVSCTATVPSGSKCVASSQGGTQTLKSVAVSATTVTVTATASGSDTFTIICV